MNGFNEATGVLVNMLRMLPDIYVAYSSATNMPFVECEKDTKNDRVFIFEEEKSFQNFAYAYKKQNLIMKGVKYAESERMKLFNTLMVINVDEIVFFTKYGTCTLTLSDFIKKKDFTGVPDSKMPIENPQLQLSGLYLMQETARLGKDIKPQDIKGLTEEYTANLLKARFIFPVKIDGDLSELDEKVRNKQFRLPLLNLPNGDVFQPLFTDNMELEKYSKGEKIPALAVPLKGLPALLANDSKGFMINPNGFHTVLTKELLKGLLTNLEK